MSQPDNEMDMEELLDRVNRLMEEDSDKDDQTFDFEPDFDSRPNLDDTVVFLNASNDYGRTVRNAANGYGRGVPQPEVPVDDYYEDDPGFGDETMVIPSEEESEDTPAPSIHAYNADFRRQRSGDRRKSASPVSNHQNPPTKQPPAPENTAAAAAQKAKKTKKKSGCLTKLLLFLLVITVLGVGLHFLLRPPIEKENLGKRKIGTSTILLCGTDISGDRTDTMMLLFLDSVNNEAGLLTLPRDTYTVTAYGASNKLNSAYGRNGCGEEGMQVLLDYVQDIIGYRPDGYMLVQLPMLRDLVELMGGVEFEVPKDMTSVGTENQSISLKEGLQKLNGEEAMALLRYRYGYYNQDLGRQDVQKQFLKACIGQWASLSNLSKFPQALDLFSSQGMTNLNTGNFIWIGANLLKCGFRNISTDTLPGYATYIGDQSYYVLYPDQVASLISEKYNPFTRDITVDDLDIAVE